MKIETQIAQPRHLQDIYRIEKFCYPHEFLTEKNMEKILSRLNSDGFVILDKLDRVLSYVLYDSNDGEIEILRLGTHEFHRQCGYASRLLDMVKAKMSETKPRITMHVPDYLLGGQIFLRKRGFIASKIDYNHYRKHHTDSFQFVFLKEWSEIDKEAVIEEEIIASSGV